jgi:UBA/TS-N domain.
VGFSENRAKKALLLSGMDVERATNWIFEVIVLFSPHLPYKAKLIFVILEYG